MEPLTLDDESLYLALARRVLRRDKADDGGRGTLGAIRKLLHLADERAGSLEDMARLQSQPGAGSKDQELVFRTACERAWAEGKAGKMELGLLLNLAHLLEIDQQQADRIFESVRTRRQAASGPGMEISDPLLVLSRPRPGGARAPSPLFDRWVPALLTFGVLVLAAVVVLR